VPPVRVRADLFTMGASETIERERGPLALSDAEGSAVPATAARTMSCLQGTGWPAVGDRPPAVVKTANRGELGLKTSGAKKHVLEPARSIPASEAS
jgi:hypothetical protein